MIYMDLETIPNEKAIKSDAWKRKKVKYLKRDKILVDHDAGLNPVFGQILCISAAYRIGYDWLNFSEVSNDEKQLLINFLEYVNKAPTSIQNVWCAYNGLNFDIPFFAKRCLFHKITLPSYLRIENKKPWEIEHKDPMVVLKFGSFQNHTSLDEACFLLGVDTPKEGIDGSEVWEAHKDGKDEEIRLYCNRDVKALYSVVNELKKLNAM